MLLNPGSRVSFAIWWPKATFRMGLLVSGHAKSLKTRPLLRITLVRMGKLRVLADHEYVRPEAAVRTRRTGEGDS